MGLFRMPQRWYARRVGPVEFFVIDANDPDQDGQMQWLSKALGSSRAPWQVLVFHQPVYSCGRHGSTPEVQSELLPVTRGNGVDLVVNGHDHDYQRFAPIRRDHLRRVGRRCRIVVRGGRLPARNAPAGRLERRRLPVPVHLGDISRAQGSCGVGAG